MCDSHNFDHSNKRLLFQYTRIVIETKKAFLFEMYNQEVWLPKSHTTIVRSQGYITIPLWLAERCNFIQTYKKVKATEEYKRNIGKWAGSQIYEWERIAPDFSIDLRLKHAS